MKPNNLSALLLAGCCLLPAMASALPSDSEQPIHIQADTADLDDKKGTAIYRGDVVITQGTLKITGHTVTLVQGKSGDVEYFKSVGNQAYYEQIPNEGDDLLKAWGNTIEYFLPKDTIVITDQAKVSQSGNTTRGEKITYNIKQEQVNVGRAQPGSVSKPEPRVHMVIQPKKKSGTEHE